MYQCGIKQHLFCSEMPVPCNEKSNKKSESFFVLGSDGSGKDAIKIKASGYRYPRYEKTYVDNEFEKNFIAEEHLSMNGTDVFNFTIRVPENIKILLNHSNISIENIDYVVFHQSNEFIIKFLAKLKLPMKCIPISLVSSGTHLDRLCL